MSAQKEYKPKPGIGYVKKYENKDGKETVKQNLTLYLDVLGWPEIPGETKDKKGQRVFRLTMFKNDFKKKGDFNAPDYNIRVSKTQDESAGAGGGAATTPELPI